MRTRLTNTILTVEIESLGAELKSISTNRDKHEYLWQGHSDSWDRQSPILFPIVGALVDKKYSYNEKTYNMMSHGFAQDMEFTIKDSSQEHVIFSLKQNDKSLIHYPFDFELNITYKLSGNSINVAYMVINNSDITLPFSIGAHPGFNCPIEPELTYNDYELTLNEKETSTRIFKGEKVLTGKREDCLNNENVIQLSHDIFDRGAFIFDDLNSTNIEFSSKKGKKKVIMDFTGFPYFGIWKRAFTKAEYVCLEPWFGIDSTESDSPEFLDKAGLVHLKPCKTFNADYTVEIF